MKKLRKNSKESRIISEEDSKNLFHRLNAINEIAMVHEALGNYLEAEPMLEDYYKEDKKLSVLITTIQLTLK